MRLLVAYPTAFFVGRLEIVDIQHLAGAAASANRASKAFSSARVMFSRLRIRMRWRADDLLASVALSSTDGLGVWCI